MKIIILNDIKLEVMNMDDISLNAKNTNILWIFFETLKSSGEVP